MLDDNPFLELSDERAGARGVRPRQQRHAGAAGRARGRTGAVASATRTTCRCPTRRRTTTASRRLSAEDGQSWEGDGTQEMAPDDGEWGGDAKAHGNNLGTEDDVDAGELARTQETLQAHLHAQALATRLGDEDRVALRFLIESLNDDGYLEDSLEELAAGAVAGRRGGDGAAAAPFPGRPEHLAGFRSGRCGRQRPGRMPAPAAACACSVQLPADDAAAGAAGRGRAHLLAADGPAGAARRAASVAAVQCQRRRRSRRPSR